MSASYDAAMNNPTEKNISLKLARRVCFLAAGALALSVRLLAASESVKPPAWVTKGSGAYEKSGQSMISGVGLVAGIQNPSFAVAVANLRACAKVRDLVNTYFSKLSKNEAALTGDGATINSMKSLSEGTLRSARISDSWSDPSDGIVFSLCEIELSSLTDASLKSSAPELKSRAESEDGLAERAFDALAGNEEEPDKPERRGLSSPALAHPWEGSVEAITTVAFSPDGFKILSAGNGTLSLRWVATGHALWSKSATADFVAFSPDGSIAASLGVDGLASAREAFTGNILTTSLNEIQGAKLIQDYLQGGSAGSEEQTLSITAKNHVKSSLASVGINISGSCLERDFQQTTSSDDSGKVSEEQDILLASTFTFSGTGQRASIQRLMSVAATNSTTVEHLLVNYDLISSKGNSGLLASTDGRLSFYDPAGKHARRTISVPRLNTAVFSPEGDVVLTGSGALKDNLILWDPEKETRLAAWTLPAPVTALAFSPDGRMVALGLGSGKDNLQILRFSAATDGRVSYDQYAEIYSLAALTGGAAE